MTPAQQRVVFRVGAAMALLLLLAFVAHMTRQLGWVAAPNQEWHATIR